MDDSIDENDSEKPDSICKKRGFNVKKKGRETPLVWNYFPKDNEVMGQTNPCKCNKCGAQYIRKTSHGTKNLLNHLQNL